MTSSLDYALDRTHPLHRGNRRSLAAKAIVPCTFSRVSKVRFNLGEGLADVPRRPRQGDEQSVEIHLDQIVVEVLAHGVVAPRTCVIDALNSVHLTRWKESSSDPDLVTL
jgi:hypothetical protein